MTEPLNGEMLQPSSSQAFSVGDTVQFNRGKHVPTMTVIAINKDSVVCFWFSKDWHPCYCEFDFAYVEKVMRR